MSVETAAGIVYENPATGEHCVILEAPAENGGARLLALLTVRPGGAVAGEHVHGLSHERFGVLGGELGVRLDGTDRVGRRGDAFAIAAGRRHSWWNAGDEPARVLVEISPPGRTVEMIVSLFALGRDGMTDAKGRPNLLQAALLAREFDAEIRFTSPPPALQRVLFALLAPVAHARGYRATREYGEPERVGARELEALRAEAGAAFAWAATSRQPRGKPVPAA